MLPTIETLCQAALALPENQRAELANRLRASLVSPANTQFEDDFRLLAEKWRRETQLESSISKKWQHPVYQKIIAMGEKAVPLILLELRDRPGMWFEALKSITGQSPVPAEARTDPRRARECWLQWGKEKGYLETSRR